MKKNGDHIFLDTNVLINSVIGTESDSLCLKFLYSLGHITLYTSSLSVAQIASVFQKRKSKTEIVKIIKRIQTKFKIVSFTNDDISEAIKIEQTDLEDNIQYVISQKAGCAYFITNNIKDYRCFNNINVLKPEKIRSII